MQVVNLHRSLVSESVDSKGDFTIPWMLGTYGLVVGSADALNPSNG